MKHGYIYAAYGDHYIKRAIDSARSLRKVTKHPIHLFTIDGANVEPNTFDCITYLNKDVLEHKYFIKIAAMRSSVFDKTIYLDSDTYVLHSIDDLFDPYLTNFDFIAPHSFWRENQHSTIVSLTTSLIGFKKNEITNEVLSQWEIDFLDGVSQKKPGWDQGYLSQAIYRSSARLMVTPPEYHCLYESTNSFHGKVRVISTHLPYSDVFLKINSTHNHRTWNGISKILSYLSKTDDPSSWGVSNSIDISLK